eukprot:13888694-Heterocapsa_arctica.AAC.1
MEIAYYVGKNAGATHLWWKCKALNDQSNFGFTKLIQERHKEQNQPECFWTTGVVTKDWTTLPDSVPMKEEDL